MLLNNKSIWHDPYWHQHPISVSHSKTHHRIDVSLNLKAWNLRTKHVGYRNFPTAYCFLWSSAKIPRRLTVKLSNMYSTNSPISFYKGQGSDSTDIDVINMMPLKDMITYCRNEVLSCRDIWKYFRLDTGSLNHAVGICTNFHGGIMKFPDFFVSTKLTHDQ